MVTRRRMVSPFFMWMVHTCSCLLYTSGRLWGFVNYCYGWRNTWVCLSDPDNTDLAADPEVLPEKTVYYPAADPVPAPSSGVSGLAAVLVVLVVAGTAVLIPVVCRGGRRPGE